MANVRRKGVHGTTTPARRCDFLCAMDTAAGSSSRLLVAVFGPTSSGKTRLSIDLCARLAADLEPVVVSADSRQVYRYMDIGTSKTTPAEMRGFRHEMLSVADPAGKYELESYVTTARRHIEQCWTDGRLPIVVGGTAVYVKSLLEGWDVNRSAGARTSLRRDFPRSMASDAYETLRRLDSRVAARVHPNNYDAVINALARLMTGPATERHARAAPKVRTVVLGLDQPARRLDARVARTFDQQMERGLYEEVLKLCSRYDLDAEMRRRGRDSPHQVLHTHGYREFWETASERGKPVRSLTASDMAVVRERVVAHIQGYTRRQRSAFRKLSGLRMVRTAEQAYQEVTTAAHW
jgi:tRNA dimethylallyltransferase